MSASFCRRLINILSTRSSYCHTPCLPVCVCVCVCVRFCFDSIISIVPARKDQSFTETKAIDQINHSGDPIVFQAHLFTNPINSHPLKSSCGKQDVTQDETVAPKRQSHWFSLFISDISHPTVLWLGAGYQKKCIFWACAWRGYTSRGETCFHAYIKGNRTTKMTHLAC